MVGYTRLKHEEESGKTTTGERGLLSLISFWWILDVLKIGNKRPLELSDWYPFGDEKNSRNATDELEVLWEVEVQRGTSSATSLIWCLLRMCSASRYCLLTALSLTFVLSNSAILVSMTIILRELMRPEGPTVHILYICAGVVCVASVLKSLAKNHMMLGGRLPVMRWRMAIAGLVYKKLLQINQAVFLELTSGRILNIITADIQRFDLVIHRIFSTIAFLLDATVIAVLLWYLVGTASLMGVLYLFLSSCICGVLCKDCEQLRTRAANIGDQRLGLVNALVAGIRTVKMTGWEWPFRDQVQELRKQEVRMLHQKNVVVSTSLMLLLTSKSLACLVALLSTHIFGYGLTSFRVFSILLLMGFVNSDLRFLPYTAFDLADFYSAVKRSCKLLKVLAQKARPLDNSSRKTTLFNSYNNSPVCLSLKSVSSSFGSDKNSPSAVTNITLHAKANELITVVGKVGSGKTSLLLTILGELPVVKGHRSVQGNVVYVPQQPWVFSATVRENILFGKDFIESHFRKIIEACGLEKDIQNFPNGDQTVIGQRGVLLSGGQRLRVGLARALYADADIYLLDDPLSAVDAKVGRQLYKECITGILQEKAVILVTHQTQHLKEDNIVVVLRNGKIAFKRKFGELRGEGISELQESLVLKDSAPESTSNNEEHPVESKLDEAGYEGLITGDEGREVTSVPLRSYVKYITAGIPGPLAVLLLVFFVGVQAINVLSDWVFLQIQTSSMYDNIFQSPTVLLYCGLLAGILGGTMIKALSFLICALNSSKNLHNKMIVSVLKTHMRFFDTTPVGRIINRFSRDVSVMDDLLPITGLDTMENCLITVAGFMVPVVLNPWLLIFITPFLVPLVLIGRFYAKPSNDLIRLECISRSPVFSHLSDTLEGLVTIRAHGMTDRFLGKFHRYQNEHTKVREMMFGAANGLAVWMDTLEAGFTVVVMVAAFLTKIQAGAAVMSFIYALQVTFDTCQWSIQLLILTENYMTSAERVMSYCNLESEPGYETSTQPPADWPRVGSLRLRNLSLRYLPGAPEILKGIDLDIHPREKIGIVGRTGAGKSSIVSALFRMPEPEGCIFIDGVDIQTLNIQRSRRAISVIPQDPVLFDGTLRFNLDPFKKFSDNDIWRALEEAGLKPTIRSLPRKLYQKIQESGTNLSSGERQLVCLSRALLQRSKIIVLDEATANVDYKTDALIQDTIRNKFKECTVITIAHRLQTILDYDKVVVLDSGRVVSYGSPDSVISTL